MGLFSSKDKIHVDTSVIRVIGDDNIPNARKTVPITSVLQDLDIPEQFVEYGLSGGFRSFERMYSFAKSEKSYYGLPNTKILSSTSARSAVQAAIETEIGLPVVITYAHYMPINNLHVGWQQCYDIYRYDRFTNELKLLSEEKGTPVYLDNIVAHHRIIPDQEPEAGSLQMFEGTDNPMSGYTPERPALLDSGLGDLITDDLWVEGIDEIESVVIHYVWLENGGIQKDTITVKLDDYLQDTEYYQARYVYQLGGETLYGYWTYRAGANDHPDLDNHYDLTRDSPGTFFPFTIFRHHGENYAEGARKNSLEYKSNKAMLARAGLDYQYLADSLHENDLTNIEQLVMLQGVPMNSDDMVELRYLHSFFRRVYLQVRDDPKVAGQQYSMSIADADFKLILSFRDITSKTFAGQIGNVGDVTASQKTLDTIHTAEISSVYTAGRATRGTQDQYFFQLQITSTTVQEIKIDTPRFRYDIFKGESVGGGASSDKMLIPLDYELCQKLTFLDKEYLYSRSLHFVMNSVVIEKRGFLQSTGFKIIMVIIAIVMAIPSGGQSFSWAKVVAALTSTATLKAIVWKLVVERIIAEVTFRVLVKLVGSETAMLLAVSAVIAGLAYNGGAFNIPKDTWADKLLGMSTNLSSPVQNLQQDQMAELRSAMLELEAMASEQMALLEETNDLLTPQNILDPLTFVGQQPNIIWGEDPENLYDRTVNADNIGTAGFEIIENFVDISLKLPDVNATLGKHA